MSAAHLLRQVRRHVPQALLLAYVLVFLVFLLAPIFFVVLVSLSDAAFIAFPVANFSLRWYYRLLEYTPLLVALRDSRRDPRCTCRVGARAQHVARGRRGLHLSARAVVGPDDPARCRLAL
jgi:hypothetical protein